MLFAYGQTGCGKTHTFIGPEHSWGTVGHDDWGLFPRACATVFEELEGRGGACKWCLHASAVEFYSMMGYGECRHTEVNI